MKIRFKFGIACLMILLIPAASVFAVLSFYLHSKGEAFEHTANLVLNNHKIELGRNLENIQVLESFMMLFKQIDSEKFNQLVMKANINSQGTTIAYDEHSGSILSYGTPYQGNIHSLIEKIQGKLDANEMVSFALSHYITYAKHAENNILLIYLVPLSYIEQKITRGYPNICVIYQFGDSKVANPVCTQSSGPWIFTKTIEFNLLQMEEFQGREINQTYSVELKSLVSGDYYIILSSALITLFAIYILSFILRQKQLAKEEKEIETLENKVRLATVNALNHEIRTPIAMLKMYISKLKSEHKEKRGDVCHLGDIAWICDTIENIATSCLMYSRSGFDNAITTQESHFDLPLFKSKISDFFHSYPQTKGNKNLIFHCQGGDSFNVDTEKLFQVVTNTLGNSLKYSDDGNIHCHIKLAKDKCSLVILLRDQGETFTRAQLNELINPFSSQQLAHTSSGIGLFLCKNIVESLDGRFYVRSPKQGGLNVLIRFPINRQINSRMPCPNMTDFAFNRILIIEDSDFICQHYRAEFASLNLQIETALTGNEAIEKNAQFQADVILSDYHLPDYPLKELMDKLMDQYPKTGLNPKPKIIINSANTREEIDLSFLDRLGDAKPFSFIQKPVTLAKLTELATPS